MAWPARSAISGVMGYWFALPRMPSVPKSFIVPVGSVFGCGWQEKVVWGGERAGRFLFFDELGDGGVVGAGGPDVAEEVGRVDVAVGEEEIAVAATAVHDVGVEFAAEFGASFGEDAGQVGHFF